jgi:hypothetical protein
MCFGARKKKRFEGSKIFCKISLTQTMDIMVKERRMLSVTRWETSDLVHDDTTFLLYCVDNVRAVVVGLEEGVAFGLLDVVVLDGSTNRTERMQMNTVLRAVFQKYGSIHVLKSTATSKPNLKYFRKKFKNAQRYQNLKKVVHAGLRLIGLAAKISSSAAVV